MSAPTLHQTHETPAPHPASGGGRPNALLLDSPPPDIHRAKEQSPASRPIHGTAVFVTDIVRALLTYGSYDCYCFRRGRVTADADRCGGWGELSDRVTVLDSNNIDDLAAYAQPVLASGGPDLLDQQCVRRLFSPKGDWPITGVIQALESKYPPLWILPLAVGDLRPWDALVCPSRAGRRVVENHLDALAETYPLLANLQPLPRVQLPVIPMGTEPPHDDASQRTEARHRLNLADDDVLVLYVGRLSPTAKCDLLPLLHAFMKLPPLAHGELRLMIAGDDTRHRMGDSLRSIANQLGCSNRVVVRSDLPPADKRDLLCAADVFVSPSDHTQETFGLTIIEALAAGLPVVASDWDGYREIVSHGATGFLVPTYWTELGRLFDALHLCGSPGVDGILPGATIVDVEALRGYLQMTTHDRNRREEMRREARRAVQERFAWPVIVRQYEALWDELRARARRDAPASVERTGAFAGHVRSTFAHYPTALLADSLDVGLGGMPEEIERLLATSKQMPRPPIPSFDTVTDEIRATLRASSPQAIGALVSSLSGHASASELTVRLVIARLLKHGILRPQVPPIS